MAAMRSRPAAVGAVAAILVLAGIAVTWQWARADEEVGAKAKAAMSEKVTKAIGAKVVKAFPGAKVVKVDPEPKMLVFYEVELTQDGKEMEVEAFVNGEILSVESEISQAALPKVVADAAAAAANGAKITEVERKEVRATISVVRLKKPRTVYEVEFEKDGKEVEVQIDASGKVLRTRAEEADDDDEDDDD